MRHQDDAASPRSLGPLPNENVDTGSRSSASPWCCRARGRLRDRFVPPAARPAARRRLVGQESRRRRARRCGDQIMAEHGRAAAFLSPTGSSPSNEGRGYVLRRMLRRVVSHGRRLGIEREVLGPDRRGRRGRLRRRLSRARENGRSSRWSLLGGGSFLRHAASRDGAVRRGEGQGQPPRGPGDVAFHLSDTFGFPIELTVENAGMQVDEDQFRTLLQEQKTGRGRRSRRWRSGWTPAPMPPTKRP